MPSTVNINSRSLVHASSAGMSQAFPDVCKTPAPPAPSPVPIPYPNIAMSSDTDGTATVKGNGASCMVKGSNFRMSSGDEAGVAMGVASNKIKGKAEFVMYSFDVKIEGNNACRLSDPMQQNMGSANAMGPAEVQAMIVGFVLGGTDRAKACLNKARNEKAQKKPGGAAAAWDASGIVSEHRAAIQEVVTSQQLKVIFRATKPECARWISQKYQPKPHDIIAGTTITAGGKVPVTVTAAWLESYKLTRETLAEFGPDKVAAFDFSTGSAIHTYATASPSGVRGAASASEFIGIVGSTEASEVGKPILANIPQGIFAKNSYRNKYVTGDYDLQDVIADRDVSCKRLLQKGEAFGAFQREVNKKMGWDGIQHGPQAQWVAQVSHGDYSDFSMPAKLGGWLNSLRGAPIPTVEIAEGRRAPIIDSKLTVVTPKGATALDNEDQVRDYLVCCGCKKPAKGKD